MCLELGEGGRKQGDQVTGWSRGVVGHMMSGMWTMPGTPAFPLSVKGGPGGLGAEGV